MRDELALRRTARTQDDLLTRAQILAAGYTDEWIEAQLTARRMLRLHRKVYLTTTGAPTERQRQRAALLCTGPSAALSHATAAARHGLSVPGDGRVHVVVPYGSSAHDRDDVALHRSRAFAHLVVDRSDLPTVSRPDTCLDLAVAASDPRTAMRTMLHAALGMKVSARQLLTVMELRRPRRYRKPLKDAARLLAEGVSSALESRYTVDVEDAHGLPRARRQAAVRVGGSTRYEDCEYETPEGPVTVRLDGWRWHSDRASAFVDRARDNAAELEGRARLTFGWEEVTGTPCRTAAMVTAILRRRGLLLRTTTATCECLSVPQDGQALTRR
ncbi:hypothetical protein [Actinomycetospora cinnamomea]|uniref:Transcriptional regulator, AbiEi antitoxin, Type IV TA system n=1 Tax=Actinomycetospora cinnamomea TaxID=663609 RepID=A0A2U1EYA8_9PSEU|nr:hypothetical protein [Actinomycetospora cinnamomea]PVZ04913.1 hypothetical protein C8D89_11617 [Actinomycetospora cinnamomea]